MFLFVFRGHAVVSGGLNGSISGCLLMSKNSCSPSRQGSVQSQFHYRGLKWFAVSEAKLSHIVETCKLSPFFFACSVCWYSLVLFFCLFDNLNMKCKFLKYAYRAYFLLSSKHLRCLQIYHLDLKSDM